MKTKEDRILEHLGLEVRKSREEAGLTQRQLAERIQISQSSLNGIETNNKRVKVVDLLRIASFFNRSVGSFFLDLDGVGDASSRDFANGIRLGIQTLQRSLSASFVESTFLLEQVSRESNRTCLEASLLRALAKDEESNNIAKTFVALTSKHSKAPEVKAFLAEISQNYEDATLAWWELAEEQKVANVRSSYLRRALSAHENIEDHEARNEWGLKLRVSLAENDPTLPSVTIKSLYEDAGKCLEVVARGKGLVDETLLSNSWLVYIYTFRNLDIRSCESCLEMISLLIMRADPLVSEAAVVEHNVASAILLFYNKSVKDAHDKLTEIIFGRNEDNISVGGNYLLKTKIDSHHHKAFKSDPLIAALAFLAWSKGLLSEDEDTVSVYIEEMLGRASLLKSTRLTTMANCMAAFVYFDIQKYEKAHVYAKEALLTSESSLRKPWYAEAFALYQLSTAIMEDHDCVENALTKIEKGLKVREELGSKVGSHGMRYRASVACWKIKEFKSAHKLLRPSLKKIKADRKWEKLFEPPLLIMEARILLREGQLEKALVKAELAKEKAKAFGADLWQKEACDFIRANRSVERRP